MIFNQNRLPTQPPALTSRQARRKNKGYNNQPVKRPALDPGALLNWLITTIAVAVVAPYVVLDLILFVVDHAGATSSDWHSTFVSLASADPISWGYLARSWNGISMFAASIAIWLRLTRGEPVASWLRYLRARTRQAVRSQLLRCGQQLMSVQKVRRTVVLVRRKTRQAGRRVSAWTKRHPNMASAAICTPMLGVWALVVTHVSLNPQHTVTPLPVPLKLSELKIDSEAAIRRADGSIVSGSATVKDEGNGRYVLQFDTPDASPGTSVQASHAAATSVEAQSVHEGVQQGAQSDRGQRAERESRADSRTLTRSAM